MARPALKKENENKKNKFGFDVQTPLLSSDFGLQLTETWSHVSVFPDASKIK